MASRQPAPSEFSAAYHEHVDFVWRVLARRGVEASELEDATQEVFVVAHRRWGAWEDQAPMRAWLYGVACRVASTHHRGRRRARRKHDELVLLDFETHEVSNWNLECETGDFGMTIDEARALTTYGGEDISQPEGDDRSFLFRSVMEDAEGVGWVSNHTGLLFDASIGAAGGVGEIHHPSVDRDPSELGRGCEPPQDAYEWWSYDVTGEDVDLLLFDAAWLAFFDTAVHEAVLADAEVGPGNPSLDILAYPRSIAEFDPSSAEFVIVIEWLR